MLPRTMSQSKALHEVKERLSRLGYFQTDPMRGGTCYYARRGCMRFKIRVSDHQWNKGTKRADVVCSIEIIGPTILADIDYQVRMADKAFLRESVAKRVA